VRFWDTSAILPLISQEPLSEEMRRLLEEDAGMVVWWATRVECISAISRRVREGSFDPGQEASARGLRRPVRKLDGGTAHRPAARLRRVDPHCLSASVACSRPYRVEEMLTAQQHYGDSV